MVPCWSLTNTLDYELDTIQRHPNPLNSFLFKLLHREDYSIIRYSLDHFADFFRGLREIQELLEGLEMPAMLRGPMERAAQILREPSLQELSQTPERGQILATPTIALRQSAARKIQKTGYWNSSISMVAWMRGTPWPWP